MGKRRTYMSIVSENTYELKISVTVKMFTERDDWTDECVENGKEETKFTYTVEAFDGEGCYVSQGSGGSLEEAITSFERNW